MAVGRAGSGRSTATVLFTDLVGSTELRSRLGPAAEALRRKHDGLLTRAIQANQGQVVKNVGDGVMATFVGAADAVAAAVAIQQAIDRQNQAGDAPVRLELRIGLSAGDVTFEERDCFGIPVIEAARLCAAAEGGQILVSEVVMLLAGGPAAGHDFRTLGNLDLKGLSTSLSVWEVGWTPVAVSPVPLPALLTDIGRIFVARDDELDRLGQLWKEAVAGELRLALIAGEPGVGKTRLAAELAVQVYEQGTTVLAGRCDEGLGVPFQPFVEALRHFVDHTPASQLAERLGRYGGELVRLLPELAERVPGLSPPLRSDAETERYRLLDAVAAWLAVLSEEDPLLLVFDDLQWAAKPTLLLLRHVVRSSGPGRLLVVATYRDTELSRDHPLVEILADLRRQSGVERLSLSGLDQAGVTTYLAQAVGHGLDVEELAVARAIHSETEGNPFFVREVIRHLTETGAIERQDDRWVIQRIEEFGIPEGVREVVGRRLGRVSEEANQALRVAAVVGTEFEFQVVRRAGGLDEEQLLSALEEAITSRLVIETPGPGSRHRFAHTLVRDTLYDELSGARRLALHRRVAEALEAVHAGDLDDHLPALAYHWARASPPTTHARAADYAARAGDRALVQLAHQEAAAYYRQALELLEIAAEPADETKETDLLIALGEAEHRAGEPGYRAHLLEAARRAEQLGDADRLARAGLAGYRGLWDRSLSADTERVMVLEAALRARGARDDVMRARLLAVLAAELMFTADKNRRRGLSDEALAIARRLGDRPTLARVLLSRCAAIWDPAMLTERRSNAAELRSLAAQLGDPFVRVWASLYSFETAMESGDVDEADRHLGEAQQSASEVERALWWFAAFPRVGRVLLAGRVREANDLAQEALEIGLATQPLHEVRMHFGVQRYQIRFEQGRLGELVTKLAKAVDDSGHVETRAMLTQAYCELGQWHEARDAFEELARTLPDLPPDPNWIVTMTRSAAVCAQLGDAAASRMVYDLLLPCRTQVAGQGIVWTGAVAHYLGSLAAGLGLLDEAVGHFDAAAATHIRIGAPTWLARTRLEWARLLVARRQPGDTERAHQLLGQALVTARDLGLAKVEGDAAALLASFD